MGVSLGKSTSSVLLTTFHLLQFAETVHDLGIAFFDFKKTFDTVPHLIVIVRKLKVIFCGQTFPLVGFQLLLSKFHVLSVVLQGSEPGPFLFIFYANSI